MSSDSEWKMTMKVSFLPRFRCGEKKNNITESQEDTRSHETFQGEKRAVVIPSVGGSRSSTSPGRVDTTAFLSYRERSEKKEPR